MLPVLDPRPGIPLPDEEEPPSPGMRDARLPSPLPVEEPRPGRLPPEEEPPRPGSIEARLPRPLPVEEPELPRPGREPIPGS